MRWSQARSALSTWARLLAAGLCIIPVAVAVAVYAFSQSERVRASVAVVLCGLSLVAGAMGLWSWWSWRAVRHEVQLLRLESSLMTTAALQRFFETKVELEQLQYAPPHGHPAKSYKAERPWDGKWRR